MLLNNKRFELFFNTYYEPVYLFSLKYVREEPCSSGYSSECFCPFIREERKFLRHRKKPNLSLIRLHTTFVLIICDIPRSHKNIFHNGKEEEEQNCLHEITYQETLRLLSFAISQLPPQTREIIQLGLEGNNNTEIADLLHISVNTVKSMKKSAYRRLREILGKEYTLLILKLLGW